MGQRNLELIRDASDTAPRLPAVTSAQYGVSSSRSVVFSAGRVSATQPDRLASASRSWAQRWASVLVLNDLARGATPRRRTCACQRPRSFLMVAIVCCSNHSCLLSEGRQRLGAKDYPCWPASKPLCR